MLLKDRDILALTFDPELQVVIMKWNGFSSSIEFRKANEDVLQKLQANASYKLIADLRQMKIIALQDQQWLYNNWLPRAITAGLSFVAIVESDDYFNRLTVDAVSQKIDDKITIRYFNNILSARSWIRNL